MTTRDGEVTGQQKSALLVLFVTFFIDILGFGLVLTLSPFYVQKYPYLFGMRVSPGVAVGALTACYPILQLICAPLWGRLSDRVGRRPIILMSLLGNALAWLLFGFARSLEVLFLARILAGILSSASLPTVQAYIADSTPPHKRAIWNGIVVGMGFSFGFMLGPPIGGLLGTTPWPDWMNAIARVFPGGGGAIAQNHLSYPAFLAAGIAFINFLVSTRRLPESLSDEMRERAGAHRDIFPFERLKAALSAPRMGAMLLILGLSTFAMQALEQNLTLFGSRDVTAIATVDNWSRLTPKYIENRRVYAVEYGPGSAPSVPVVSAIERSHVAPDSEEHPRLIASPELPGDTVRARHHLAPDETGMVLFVVAFIVGMIQGGAIKKLVPRFGEVALVGSGCLIGAIGFFLVPGGVTFWLLTGAAAVVAVGSSLINPCLRGLISIETEAHSQGSVLGISESVRGLAMATGPLIGGWLFDLGAWIPFVMGGVCMIAGAILTLRLRGMRADHSEVQPGVDPELASVAGR